MAAPIAMVVVPIATLLFVLLAFHVGRSGGSVRAVYLFGLVGVSLVVALSALGGLARAVGNAIADPRTTITPCEQIRQQVQLPFDGYESSSAAAGIGTLAQGQDFTPPPIPTFPPFPTFEAPSPDEFPIPSFEPVPVPSPFPFPAPDLDIPQGGFFDCPQTSGRSRAGVEAIQSGILFALAVGLGWANAVGARNDLNREDRHGR